MNINIELVNGHNEPKPVNDKNTGQIRYFRQKAYADLGGAYPKEIQIQVSQPMAPGRYIATVPLKVGKYDALEINPFEVWQLRPAKPEEIRKAV